MRALRVDKLTYAALEATLEEHAIGRGQRGRAGAADAADDARRRSGAAPTRWRRR